MTLKIPHLLAAGLIALVSLVQLTEKCLACSCVETTPATAFAQAGLVFRGRVVETDGDTTFDQVHVVFSVDTVWKGPAESTIELAGEPGSSCNAVFHVGENVVVYAYEHGGAWRTDTCSRTASLSRAGDDLVFLAGQTPLTTATPSSPSPTAPPTAEPATQAAPAGTPSPTTAEQQPEDDESGGPRRLMITLAALAVPLLFAAAVVARRRFSTARD